MSLFDPPWRFDPYQNPKDVHWGGYYCLFQLFAPNVIGGANVIGPNNHVVTVELKNGAKIAHQRNENVETGGISFYEGIFLIDVGIPSADEGAFVTFKLNGSVYSEGDPTPPDMRCARAVGTGEIINLTTNETIYAGLPLNIYDTATWHANLNAGIDALNAYFSAIDPAFPPLQHYVDDGIQFVFMRRAGSHDPSEWVRQKDSAGNPIQCGGAPVAPPSGPGSPTYLSMTCQWFLYPKGGHKVQASDKYFPIRTTDDKAGLDLLDADAVQSRVSDGEVTFAISSERAFRAEDTRLPFVYPLTPIPTDPTPGMSQLPYRITGFRRSAQDPFEPAQWGLTAGFVAFTGPPGPGPT